MKRIRKSLLVLTVIATFLIGATAIACADDITVKGKVITIPDAGGGTVTITFDKNVDDIDVGDVVDFTINSTNAKMEYVGTPRLNDIADSNTYSGNMEFTSLGKNNLRITFYGEYSSETIGIAPNPKAFQNNDVWVKTSPSGITVHAYGYEGTNGEKYLIGVYGDSARKKFLGSYWAKTEEHVDPLISKKESWYKPNKKYYISIFPTDGSGVPCNARRTDRTVVTSPTTKPVIKSIKVSNVKVKKYFDYSRWQTRYKTTYKLKITMSKKASGSKGYHVRVGLGQYQSTAKGKTFTISCVHDSGVSYKGSKLKVNVMTYNAPSGNGWALSPQSGTKTVKIK